MGASAHAAGFQDFSYGSTSSAPTAEKGQSKLWFADGIWWGSLFNKSSSQFEIHRLNTATERWTSTGVAIDTRNQSKADALWDGSKLYVASATSTSDGRLYRYSYDPSSDTYSLDLGFPITLLNGGAEALSIAKDTTGKVWVTYTQNGKVHVMRSGSSDASFTSPWVIPVSGASNLDPDDISSAVAYDGRIGVMWSNQNDGKMHFASHVDGASDSAWTDNPATSGTRMADDHMDLKAISGDPAGRVVAVMKTSRTGTDEPLIQLGVLRDNDSWDTYAVGVYQDQHTRPSLAVDTEHRRVYVTMSAPCCGGGTIYMKEAHLDAISFESGLGSPFIELASDPEPNNPTSTKQLVGSASGLVVEASEDTTRNYVHNRLVLGTQDTTPPETTITSGPPDSTAATDATFTFDSNEGGSTYECRLDGASFSACSSPKTYGNLAPGSHTFRVRAIDTAGNVDPTPAVHTWTVDPNGPVVFAPSADAYADEESPTTTHGSNTALRIDGGQGTHEDTYMRFTVGSLPGSVDSATLRVYATNGSGTGPKIYGAETSWTESSLNWNNRPSRTTEALDTVDPPPTSEGWVELDVSAHITGPGTYAFDIGTESGDGVVVNSKEALTNAPELVITTAGPDTTPPETSVDSGPADPTTSTAASFAFSASESNSTFECRLDGGSFAPCSSPKSYSGLAIGQHTFAVRASDAAGNVDPSPAVHTWKIDDPGAIQTLEFDATEDSFVEERRPDDNNGSLSFLDIDGGNGVHEEGFLRFDVSGVSGTVESAKLRLYATNGTWNGPEIHGASNAWDEASLTWDTRPPLIGGVLDDADGIDPDSFVEYDVTAFVTGDGPFSLALSNESTDGARFNSSEASSNQPKLIVTSNTGSPPDDVTPPQTTISDAPSDPTTSGSAEFSFQASEGGATFECRLDGGSWTGCSSPDSHTGLGAGEHTFEVRATDPAGNTDPTPATHTWTIQAVQNGVFEPVADTYVDERRPGATRGTATSLRIDGGKDTHQETLLRFDVGALAGPVIDAKIRVYVTNGTWNGPEIFGTSNSWIEDVVTWDTRPGPTTALLDDLGGVDVDAFTEFDVTAHVTGPGTYSFLMKNESTDGMLFNSREAPDPPRLIVTTSG